jgi:putative exosortase-associated protein (TIGR04073 family)
MKKLLVLMVVMLVACAPLSFAGSCPNPASHDNYAQAAGAKLFRGLTNAALGWVELLRQPVINDNKWEGLGHGVVHAIGRTGSGILEVATFFIPQVDVPVPTPSCPLEFNA